MYLRPLKEGNPKADPQVKEALDVYRRILDLLQVGHQREDVAHQESLGHARILMFELQKKAKVLAARDIGIPFLSLKF